MFHDGPAAQAKASPGTEAASALQAVTLEEGDPSAARAPPAVPTLIGAPPHSPPRLQLRTGLPFLSHAPDGIGGQVNGAC